MYVLCVMREIDNNSGRYLKDSFKATLGCQVCVADSFQATQGRQMCMADSFQVTIDMCG